MKRPRGSLALRLTIWFLFLSFLPLAVLSTFVRDDAAAAFADLVKHYQQDEADLLADYIALLGDQAPLQSLLLNRHTAQQATFVVDGSGNYLARSDAGQAAGSIGNDFSKTVVEQILAGGSGSLIEPETGRIIGYAGLPNQKATLIVVTNPAVVSAPLLKIENSALLLLAISLILVSIAGGAAIWLVVGRPLRQLTHTADQISRGNLEIEANPADMNNELAVLAGTFNQMTRQFRTLIQGLEQNIAELTQAHAALRESEERFRNIVQSMPIGIHLFQQSSDGNVTLIEFNPAADRVLRGDQSRYVGKSLAQIMPPFLDPSLLDKFRATAESGEVWQSEHVTLAGQQISLAVVTDVFQVAPGKVVATYQDITERKRAEAEREKLIAELEAKNAELERFTYTVSHDLKSPLITIRGFVGYLEQEALSGNTDRLKSDVKRISDATSKMQLLLDDLLDLSRIGRLINPPQEVSFYDLAREAAELVAGQIVQREVQVEIDPQLPAVYGDRARLIEVLQNLIDNAVKFMGDQPVPKIIIGSQVKNGETVFSVRDNGVGIEPQYHFKVFGLFDKLDAHSAGTGIGLALVKRIIEVHGGRIWVESGGPGTGSAFCFTLPLKSTVLSSTGV